jgi:hypothetical protein
MIDPSILKFATPISLTVKSLRYRPSTSTNDSIYTQDAKWFASHRDRVMVIRTAKDSEFGDVDAAIWHKGGLLYPPQLWVLVTKHPRLGHTVIPVWRGSLSDSMQTDINGYLTAESDDLIDHFLDVMASSMGVNAVDMFAWVMKYKEAQAAITSVDPNRKAN